MTSDTQTVPLTEIDSWHNLATELLSICDLLLPPPDRTADIWADQERIIPRGKSEPGPYRTDRTPYCRDIMRDAARTDIARGVYVMGVRMGKSYSLQNIIGWMLYDDPNPALYVCPSRDNANGVVHPEIESMIKACERLNAEYEGKRHGSNKLEKKFKNGGVCRLGWAGSPTQLAGFDAMIVVVDELDRVPYNPEGSVLAQAEARANTFGMSGFVLATSTPSTGSVEAYRHEITGIQHWAKAKDKDVGSAIWREWQNGTRHEWAVPCPHCKEYFVPRFELLKWTGDTMQEAMESAALACFNNGCLIEEKHKHWMNANGVYLSPGEYVDEAGQVRGHGVQSPTVSRWVSGLMSPWHTFGQAASKWAKAQASQEPAEIRACINTVFGELYAFVGEKMAWEAVKLCASDYKQGTVPQEAQALYLTVDVQGDRLVYVVRAWDNKLNSWLVDHGELFGPTDEEDVWNELEKLTNRRYSGRAIDMVGIDSGYRTSIVYSFCIRDLSRYRAFKGIGNKTTQLLVEKTVQTKTYFKTKADYFGVKRINAQDGYFKEWVQTHVKRGSTDHKDWHTFSDVSEEYCRQIVNDVQQLLPSGKTVWEEQGDNHYMDCEWMQRAMAEYKRIEHLPDPANEPIEQATPHSARGQKVTSNWANPRGQRW